MLYRTIIDELEKWHSRKHKKAFLLAGARQTGKTYIVRQFAKQYYKTYLEINFILDKKAKEIFENSTDVNGIIANLTAYYAKELIVGKTLIFLDEIEECPEARTAIKFLVDDGRFDYIESGSLLGVKYKNIKSYPVGYEELHMMYPLTLTEFFVANGVTKDTFDYLKECFDKKKTVGKVIHEKMLQLFRIYTVVGGMPAVVQQFVDTHDVGVVIKEQRNIVDLYRQDIIKYAQAEQAKITAIFDNIPSELNDTNKRFVLADIKNSARMERYENCFNWLTDAGVALPCYNVKAPKVPLKLNEQRNLFKFFLCDTGLLGAMSVENLQYELLQGNLAINTGSFLENTFAQILKSNGFELRYYDKKGFGEADFLITKGNNVIPIEIKSGNSYKAHKTLNKLMDEADWGIDEGIVFCGSDIETDGKITYYPWYMAGFLHPLEIGEGSIIDVPSFGS